VFKVDNATHFDPLLSPPSTVPSLAQSGTPSSAQDLGGPSSLSRVGAPLISSHSTDAPVRSSLQAPVPAISPITTVDYLRQDVDPRRVVSLTVPLHRCTLHHTLSLAVSPSVPSAHSILPSIVPVTLSTGSGFVCRIVSITASSCVTTSAAIHMSSHSGCLRAASTSSRFTSGSFTPTTRASGSSRSTTQRDDLFTEIPWILITDYIRTW